jgi:hypothetical protein
LSGLETPGIEFIRKARREGYTVYGGLTVPLVRKFGGWREIADRKKGSSYGARSSSSWRSSSATGTSGVRRVRRSIAATSSAWSRSLPHLELEIFNPEPDSFEHRVRRRSRPISPRTATT